MNGDDDDDETQGFPLRLVLIFPPVPNGTYLTRNTFACEGYQYQYFCG
jgi:hypothetical protein